MQGLEISDTIHPQDLAFIEGRLAANAVANNAPPYIPQDLIVIQRDDAQKIIGGLTGYTVWNWLYVDNLWVDPAHRQQGLARRLMAAAEVEAQKRGCHDAYLWTESFEGLSFYPKLGYSPFIVKPDFPNGFTRTGFMKKIVATGQEGERKWNVC